MSFKIKTKRKRERERERERERARLMRPKQVSQAQNIWSFYTFTLYGHLSSPRFFNVNHCH